MPVTEGRQPSQGGASEAFTKGLGVGRTSHRGWTGRDSARAAGQSRAAARRPARPGLAAGTVYRGAQPALGRNSCHPAQPRRGQPPAAPDADAARFPLVGRPAVAGRRPRAPAPAGAVTHLPAHNARRRHVPPRVPGDDVAEPHVSAGLTTTSGRAKVTSGRERGGEERELQLVGRGRGLWAHAR